MVSVAEALALGTRHHQAGQLAEAERIYRQILAVEPDHPHTLHQLGLLALQARQFQAAIDLIGKAIQADRSQAVFHANLGEAQRHAGNLDQAILCYRNALKLQGDLAQVHVLLGGALHDQGQHAEAAAALREALRLKPDDVAARTRLGHVLVDQGKLEDAENCFRRVLRCHDRSPDAHFNLASLLHSQGQLEDAAAGYQNVIKLKPDHFEAHNNLGTILRQQNALVEAAHHYNSALSIRPDYAAAHTNLGLLLESQGQLDEAETCFRAALQTNPGCLQSRHSLGAVLQKQGHLESAIANYQEVIRLDHDYAPARKSLGHALQVQGNLSAALSEFELAVRAAPHDAEARVQLGVLYNELGQVDLAVEECRKAVELRPDFALAHNNLASCLHARGQSEEALAFYRQAAALAPSDALLHANLAHALNYMPQVDPQTIYQEHRRWAQRHADPLTPPALPRAADRAADRRLKIGYVSPYFRQHAISVFTEPILAAHDHQRFEILCYSDVKHPDDATRRFQAAADRWIDTTADSDQQLAQRIAAEGVDILVDLTGHLEGSRLLAFARKPAPIQITYIGYQNTTGMRAMDYRLTDAFADPPGLTDRYHSEQLIRLPGAFFCYQPLSQAPPVNPLPALTAGGITFGSFNKLAKVTGEVLDTWAQVLAAVPGSRLLILADLSAQARQRVQAVMAAHGVDPNCVQLVAKRPRPEYLALHQQVDIALDTFPFNGHTTICEALWMGVPVLMLAGQTYVSRFGGSALQNLGLEGWIAQSRDEYVQTAVEWAGDLQRLQALRAGLRQRMLASPLLDAAGFTRNLEAVYRQLWDNLPSTGPATG